MTARLNRWGTAVALVSLLLAVAAVDQAAGQVPSGFPDLMPTAFTMQQGPPGPQAASPEPLPFAAPQASQPATAPPAQGIIAEPSAVFGPSFEPPRTVSPDAFHPMFRLHQTIGDDVGDAGELTTLGGFFPHPTDFGIWYVDGQFDILEDAHNPGEQTLNFAASLGAGWRWLDPSDGQIYGLSAWYDCDRSHPYFVHQVSVGGEILGDVWQMRANGYFPIGTNRQALGFSAFGPAFFRGENVLFPQTRTDLASLTGADMEFGRPLPGWLGEKGISAYAGCYYYRADKSLNTFGSSMRIEAVLSDDLTIDAKVTDDSLFKTNIAVGITWILPAAGKCKTCKCQSEDYYRMVQPVERNRTVVFAAGTVSDPALALDPTTGQPIRVVHVSSGAAAGGDGTFEHPYQTLTAAQAGSLPNDIILAYAGSVFNGQGIGLQANQRLLGDSIDHLIATVQAGTITLPHASSGATPIIQNSPGDSVTLANSNEVSGLSIQSATGAAIAGNGVSGTENVNNTTITGGAMGVNLQNSSATSTFQDLSVTGAATGVQLTNNSGSETFNGTTTINGSTTAGVNATGNNGAVSFNQLNLAATSGSGLSDTNANGLLTVTNGSISNANGSAINAANANVNLNLTNVTATNAAGGTGINVTNTSGTIGIAQTSITGGATGVNLNSDTATITLQNTSITNAATGVQIGGNQTATHLTGLTTINGSTANGFSDSNGSGAATVDQLNVAATSGTALNVVSSTGLTISNGSVSNASGTAINMNNSTVNLTLASASATNVAGGTALNLTGDAGTINIGQVNVTGGANGIVLTGSSAAATFNNVTIGGAATGITLANDSGTIIFHGTTTVNTSTVNGVFMNAVTGPVTFDDLNIAATSGTGLNASAGTGLLTISNGVISNASGTAVNINGVPLSVLLTSLSATGGTSGLILNSTTGTFAVSGAGGVAGTGGTITGTSGAGVSLTNVVGVTLNDMDITATGGDGIDVVGGGGIIFNGLVLTQSGSAYNLNTNGTNGPISLIGSTLQQTGTQDNISIQTPNSSSFLISGNSITGNEIGLLSLDFSGGADAFQIQGNTITMPNAGGDFGILMEKSGGIATLSGNSDNTVISSNPAVFIGGTYSGHISVNGAPAP